MLITELKENREAIAKRTLRLEELKNKYPEENWDALKASTVYDRITRYADWFASLKDDCDIKIVKDDRQIPDCVFVAQLNWEHDFEDMTFQKIDHDHSDMMYWIGYGLCDNADQALAAYETLIVDNPGAENYDCILVLSPILREWQPERGGFRYYKWGKYIGVQNPMNEYLYDDDHIDMIYSYHIQKIVDQ